MQGLQKIGDLAVRYDVTGRTLRYYEEIGLLWSYRPHGSQQRWYDGQAVQRLEQILLLRQLQLSIRDIQAILTSQDLQVAVDALSHKLQELNAAIGELESLRETVGRFLTLLREKGISRGDGLVLLQEQGAALTAGQPAGQPEGSKKEALTVPKETMELNHVRIVNLKPMKVAYYQTESTSPEGDAWSVMMKWAEETGLTNVGTTRYFGFNNPCPAPGQTVYGYEVWVTLPDGVEPPAPIGVKVFEGGLYAVTTTYLYEIGERWRQLDQWLASNDDQYAIGAHQCLEESVNIDRMHMDDTQLDLYLPLVRK